MINSLKLWEASQQWSKETRGKVIEAIKSHPRARDYLCLWQTPEGKDISHYTEPEHEAYREGLIDASAEPDWMIAFADYDARYTLSAELKKILQQFGVETGGLHDEASNAHLN